VLLRARLKGDGRGRRLLEDALAAMPPALKGERYRQVQLVAGGSHLREAAALGFAQAQLALWRVDAAQGAAEARDPEARALLSFLRTDGLFGVAVDRVWAEALWRTVDRADVDALLAKHLHGVRHAQATLLGEKMRRSQSGEEAARAALHFAALWQEIRGDDRFLLPLLEQVCLPPARIPAMPPTLLSALRSNGKSRGFSPLT
jgi:hypothetical protein